MVINLVIGKLEESLKFEAKKTLPKKFKINKSNTQKLLIGCTLAFVVKEDTSNEFSGLIQTYEAPVSNYETPLETDPNFEILKTDYIEAIELTL